MMSTSNLYKISDYRGTVGKSDIKLPDASYYGGTERIDALEERLTSKLDILVSNNVIRVDRKRSISLMVSSFVSGISFVLMILSIQGAVDIGWQFWASIFLASSGLAAASLLILVGIDYDKYEER